ncbi:MAG: bifunctional folylpolyglutamate synthase/dihydrofolate synthase, partial [Syntrophomonadaceae bacterium]|nr:bifunctional folylpolyglutamate synthase/dihydrofolate synthase [Syntrophomonadaceae bacterium]
MDRISSLLAELDHPEQGLAYVHVAGTNGKGSTSLMIAEILIAAGYKVGRYSSPHLHSYRERFTVNGEEIEDQVLWSYLEKTEKHIQVMLKRGEEHPTEFEVLTAVAFQYFAEQKVDVAVLEVGMGGTYDSTNVIQPLVSVITSVDFDHTAFLGSTLAEVAGNKAGIIKPVVPLVTGILGPEASQVISTRAADLGAAVYSSSNLQIATGAASSPEGQVVDIEGAGWYLPGLRFSLLGEYQLKNMAVAMTTINILRGLNFKIEADHVRQ